MGKKLVKKVSVTKGNKKVSSRRITKRKVSSKVESISFIPVSIKRLIIWGPFAIIVLAVILTVTGNRFSPAVAGASIYRGIVAHYQASVELPNIPGAVSYNIYYKQSNEGTYDHAVRNIPLSVHDYLITYLKNSDNYEYKISAVDDRGAEFWWSSVFPLEPIQSM